MTEQDLHKLHAIILGDRVEYLDHGATASGQVCGWTSVHTAGSVMMLVYGGWNSPDKRVPLHAVQSRERPGQAVVRFE